AEYAPVATAIEIAWSQLQFAKECLIKLASPGRYDLDIAQKDLLGCISNITEGYAKWGSLLPDNARLAWHAAKGSLHAAIESVDDLMNDSRTGNYRKRRLRVLSDK